MIQKLLDADEEPPPETGAESPAKILASGPEFMSIFDPTEAASSDPSIASKSDVSAAHRDYEPPSAADAIRMSGLAWSVGIVLFASIAFMMVIGWFADLLLGSSPWGIVGGIVLGSLIGFIQLFRVTSQIFKK
ncbi:MAG TPA: hypothetical protein DEA22_08025 [Blastocatellia bacterium]|nr:hypothetical protein [Blastocatellia bacterium]